MFHMFVWYNLGDPCENVICENGGSCVEDSQTGQGVCECFGDYSGRNCESKYIYDLIFCKYNVIWL